MLQFVLPALIGAAGSLIGGFMNQGAQQRENRIAREREDSAIQRRVADAREAGINPLAALGVAGAGSAAMPVSDLGGSIERAAGQVSASMLEEQTFALNAAQTLSNIRLQDAQAKAVLMEAQSRTIADRLMSAGRGGAGAEVMMPSPFGLPPMKVATPEMAQDAQTHFGEPGEWIYGPANFIESLVDSMVDRPLHRELFPGGGP